MNFFKNISNEIIKDLSLYNKTIAIVGGSSSLMENNYGKEIDQYDFVIRFNRAPTKGYEKHVGSKTSLRVMGEQFFLNRSEQYPDKKINFDYLVKNTHNTNILILCLGMIDEIQSMNKFSKSNNFFYIPTQINHKLKYNLISKFNYYKKFKFYFHNSDLSSGSLILSYLINFNLKPSVFGFDFFKNKENYSMYYSNFIEKSIVHEFDLEKELLNEFKDKNLAHFY
tara:strand:+ start:19 stop:693 length:675 start_codon:yes stop_codon:yes gene_type:complete